MIARQPYLPRFVAGGPGNLLSARVSHSWHHDPSTIGKFVSSGCIRLTNEDITDLYSTWRSHLWATDSIVLDDAWR